MCTQIHPCCLVHICTCAYVCMYMYLYTQVHTYGNSLGQNLQSKFYEWWQTSLGLAIIQLVPALDAKMPWHKLWDVPAGSMWGPADGQPTERCSEVETSENSSLSPPSAFPLPPGAGDSASHCERSQAGRYQLLIPTKGGRWWCHCLWLILQRNFSNMSEHHGLVQSGYSILDLPNNE